MITDAKRKRLWKIQISMLSYIDKICTDNNIKYFAVAGTLLGAVRHKGFIPWDDDVDIGFMRDDFNRFLSCVSNDTNCPYFLQSPINEKHYFSSCVRLRDENSTGIIDKDRNRAVHNGVYIDLIPLDYTTENKWKNKLQKEKIRFLLRLLYHAEYMREVPIIGQAETMLCKSISILFGYSRIFQAYQNVCQKYCTGSMLALLSGEPFNERYYWYEEDVKETVRVPFETTSILIPKGYDRCLKTQYGEYMVLPPESERGKQHDEKVIFDPDIKYTEYQKKMGWLQ